MQSYLITICNSVWTLISRHRSISPFLLKRHHKHLPICPIASSALRTPSAPFFVASPPLLLTPHPPQPIANRSNRHKVHQLGDAEQRDAHEQAQNAAGVGQEFRLAKQFGAFDANEIGGLEKNRHPHKAIGWL